MDLLVDKLNQIFSFFPGPISPSRPLYWYLTFSFFHLVLHIPSVYHWVPGTKCYQGNSVRIGRYPNILGSSYPSPKINIQFSLYYSYYLEPGIRNGKERVSIIPN